MPKSGEITRGPRCVYTTTVSTLPPLHVKRSIVSFKIPLYITMTIYTSATTPITAFYLRPTIILA